MSISLAALKPSIGMLKYLAIALGIYAVLFVLALIAHVIFDIEYLEFTYPDTNITLKVDVLTYLFIGAALLIFYVAEQLVLIVILIIYWIFNSFIVGRDPTTGKVVVPFALFQLIGLIPIIGGFFKAILPIPQSVIGDLASALKILRSFLEMIITGGFGAVSEAIITFIEEKVLGFG